ncbi:MAG: hypothetical protein PHN88_11120 [Ignavibacteria bacterium]|nr:hypothetical protein [Ignavibacteria bacterium]
MKKLILALSVLVIFSSSLFSQTAIISSKFTKPFFSLEGNFGYAMPMFDLSGSNIKEFYDFKNYGTNSGYMGNLKFGFTVANFRSTQLRIKWTIGYGRFFGSDNYAYNVPKVTPGWPTINYTSPLAASGTSSINLHQPYSSVGLDYVVFTDTKRTSLFTFGGDIIVSGMFGKVFDQPTGKAEEYNNITSAIRFGFGINTDYTYRATEFFGLNAGLRFQFTNLIGKTSSAVTDDRDIPFNDGGDTSINPNLKSRNMGYFGVHGGVVFYFGGRK